MDIKEKAKAKDKILEYLITNNNYNIRYEKIKKSILPSFNIDECKLLLNEIIEYGNNIIKVYDVDTPSIISIKCNGLTEKFINNGGFEELAKQDLINEQKNIEEEKLRFEKLKLDVKWTKLKVKTFWPLFIIAITGGLYSIYEIACKIIVFFSK